MNTLKRIALVTATAALMLGAADVARAETPLKIREVFPGSSSAPVREYVVLQFTASGSTDASSHTLTLIDSSGFPVNTIPVPSVASSDSQRTILMGTDNAGQSPDRSWGDGVTTNNFFDPGGGGVCIDDLDCVAWGTAVYYGGPWWASSEVGNAAPSLPDGSALRRVTSRDCATTLDPADDSDDSAADFTAVTPAPRNNASTPSETACGSQPPVQPPVQPGVDDPICAKTEADLEKRTAKVAKLKRRLRLASPEAARRIRTQIKSQRKRIKQARALIEEHC